VTRRGHAPIGAPCWVDLSTSDVDGSRRFYAELLGWEAQEPNPDFGGYFMFTREGVPVAGGYGDMEGYPADDAWKIYLASADADATVAATEGGGGAVLVGVSPVADMGRQVVLADPAGAVIGAWQEDSFPGFVELDEPGAPSWFELHTRAYDRVLDFYRDVFGWTTQVVGDSDDFRYTTMVDPVDGHQLCGVMDAPWLPEGSSGSWSVYWETADIDAMAALAVQLGGSVTDGPVDTPYGRIATVADPAGAVFRLRTAPPS
jgi:predicted enzyme related to lactoylglutathione lyase